MYYVGIDWADEAHHVYITDDSGQKLDSFPIDHNTAGMNKLQETFIDSVASWITPFSP